MEHKFYVCDCYFHAIAVSSFVWRDDMCPGIFLAYWTRGPEHYSWRYRLKDVWRILRYGHEYDDDVILDLDQARDLGEGLIELCDKWRGAKEET